MTTMRYSRNVLGLAAAMLLGAALVAGAALAQTAMPEGQQAPAAATSFSERELQSYASAVVKVHAISKDAQAKLKATEDRAASDAIQKDAEAKAVAAVEAEGLTVEKYNRIALATETDPDVRNKVLDYVSKAK